MVEFPMLHDMKVMSDLLRFDKPHMKMKKHVSPIALFAVDPQKKLKVVAIQNGSNQGDDITT